MAKGLIAFGLGLSAALIVYGIGEYFGLWEIVE